MEIKNCPGLLLEGFSKYSPLFLRRMFNGKKVSHILPYNAPEVDEEDHQEDEDDDTGVDHILAEKRGMGISLFLIPHRPGQPILDLHDQAVEDMDDKSTKKYYLKNLDEGVAGHKVDGKLKYLNMVSCQRQDEEVDHQVHNEEGRQKQACNRHDELLGEGGVM